MSYSQEFIKTAIAPDTYSPEKKTCNIVAKELGTLSYAGNPEHSLDNQAEKGLEVSNSACDIQDCTFYPKCPVKICKENCRSKVFYERWGE